MSFLYKLFEIFPNSVTGWSVGLGPKFSSSGLFDVNDSADKYSSCNVGGLAIGDGAFIVAGAGTFAIKFN